MTTQTRSERHFHNQKEKRGRSWGGGGGLWQGGFSKFPSLEVSYRSLMQQVLNVVLCVFLSAHMLPNLRGGGKYVHSNSKNRKGHNVFTTCSITSDRFFIPGCFMSCINCKQLHY